MNPKDFDIGILQALSNKSYFVFWLFALVGVFSIVLARINNSTYISALFHTTSKNNQNKSLPQSVSAPLLMLNFIIAVSLQFYILNESFNILNYSTQAAVLIKTFIAVLLFYVLKSLLQYFGANLFNRNQVFELTNSLKVYQIVGLILLPLAIFSLYQSKNFKLVVSLLAVAVLSLSTIYYWLISFKDSQQYKISLFYIFLYLCTLEILPVILVAKYLLV